MLNQTGVESKNYGAPEKTILVDEFNSTSVSVVVANTGVSAGSDGKKIIKAGTPVYGSLRARNTAFTIAGASGAKPAGVVLHDVDVTAGNANSQIVIFGTIDVSKVDATTATTLIAAEANLKMIQLVQ